jgi:hypothetical protein
VLTLAGGACSQQSNTHMHGYHSHRPLLPGINSCLPPMQPGTRCPLILQVNPQTIRLWQGIAWHVCGRNTSQGNTRTQGCLNHHREAYRCQPLQGGIHVSTVPWASHLQPDCGLDGVGILACSGMACCWLRQQQGKLMNCISATSFARGHYRTALVSSTALMCADA